MNKYKSDRALVLLFAAGALLVAAIAACSSAAPKPSSVDKADLSPPSDANNETIAAPKRDLDECAPDDDQCEQALTKDRLSTLDRVESECNNGTLSSCGFLYRSGPDGTARLKAPGGPLRWLKESRELKSIEQPEVKVSVFEGTPIFVAERKGAEVIIFFPQIRFVDNNDRSVALHFRTPAASLSILPRKLHARNVQGRAASGFERSLSPEPGGFVFAKTDCGPLVILDEKRRMGQRFQQIYQLLDGAGIIGWTKEPVDFDLGPCYSDHSLIFASDAVTPDAVLMDENKTASALDAVWQKGFAFYEHKGEGAPCVRRQVLDAHSVLEGLKTGGNLFRVERQGVHLIFFGPTVKPAGNAKPAYGDTELYTVLSVEDSALLIAPGAERSERIVAYRKEAARKWWLTEEACENDRALHGRISP